MENDYFLSHTFDQFDDFVNGRPIKPYDSDKLKSNSGYNNNSNNRFTNNHDYESYRNKVNFSNEQLHYEPYFSKSTSRIQNTHSKLYSPATSTKSLFANSQSDLNFPVIRSISQQTNYLPIVSNGVPNSVRYVPSNVVPPTVISQPVQPSIIPITNNQIHHSYHPIQQPPQLISRVSPRYLTKPAPIINTYSYQPVKLPAINKPRRFIKYTNPVKFVGRAPF